VGKILDRKKRGEKLTPLEVHEINCYIADAVLAGGIRRSAMIALFSLTDQDMLTCKFNHWYETKPHLGRANNSAVLLRHRVKKEDFMQLWEKIKHSGSGEPGFFMTNDKDLGTNPCGEVSLRPCQFCNLVEVNVSNVVDQQDLNERVRAAAFIATLQASYTNFHYLRDIWKETTEKEALIGVGMTGIASGKVL
jgi:ribonucleoside-diphosphate reductase alpha chain